MKQIILRNVLYNLGRRRGYLTTNDVAEILGKSPGTVKKWRQLSKGPAHILIEKSIRYEPNAVAEYIKRETKQPIQMVLQGYVTNDDPAIEPDPHDIVWDASQDCPGCGKHIAVKHTKNFPKMTVSRDVFCPACGELLTTIDCGELWVHHD